jgi:hypothetical protein
MGWLALIARLQCRRVQRGDVQAGHLWIRTAQFIGL